MDLASRQSQARRDCHRTDPPASLTMAGLFSADGDNEVLRGRGAGVADAVELAGVDKGGGARTDLRGLAGDGDGERALHHEEELFVHVLMGRMRGTAGSQRGLVDFEMIVRVRGAVKDSAGDVGAVLMDWQGIEGLGEGRKGDPGIVRGEGRD